MIHILLDIINDGIPPRMMNRKLLEIIYNLSDLENDIKWSSQKTIMFHKKNFQRDYT